MEILRSELFANKNKIKKLLQENKFQDILILINNICRQKTIRMSDYDLYSQITPYDMSVSSYYELEYVNASFILSNDDSYIACQDPKSKYIDLFVKLLKKADFQCILSLNSESEYLKKFEVESSKVIDYLGRPFLRDDLVKLENKTIRRITCLQWKDHSILTSEEMEFLHSYMKSFDNKLKIIHCKAGVGRTGTFIMYRALKKHENVTIDLFIDTLLDIRSQRVHLVEKDVQLQFLYQTFFK